MKVKMAKMAISYRAAILTVGAAWRGRPALASRGHFGLALPSLLVPIATKVQGQDALATKEFLAQFLPVFEAHLREKGWLQKTVFHIADEPSNHNIMSWREASIHP